MLACCFCLLFIWVYGIVCTVVLLAICCLQVVPLCCFVCLAANFSLRLFFVWFGCYLRLECLICYGLRCCLVFAVCLLGVCLLLLVGWMVWLLLGICGFWLLSFAWV